MIFYYLHYLYKIYLFHKVKKIIILNFYNYGINNIIWRKKKFIEYILLKLEEEKKRLNYNKYYFNNDYEGLLNGNIITFNDLIRVSPLIKENFLLNENDLNQYSFYMLYSLIISITNENYLYLKNNISLLGKFISLVS